MNFRGNSCAREPLLNRLRFRPIAENCYGDPIHTLICSQRAEKSTRSARFESCLGLGLEQFQVRSEFLFSLFLHSVNEQNAMQMIGFVLHSPGKQTGATKFDRLPFAV